MTSTPWANALVFSVAGALCAHLLTGYATTAPPLNRLTRCDIDSKLPTDTGPRERPVVWTETVAAIRCPTLLWRPAVLDLTLRAPAEAGAAGSIVNLHGKNRTVGVRVRETQSHEVVLGDPSAFGESLEIVLVTLNRSRGVSGVGVVAVHARPLFQAQATSLSLLACGACLGLLAWSWTAAGSARRRVLRERALAALAGLPSHWQTGALLALSSACLFARRPDAFLNPQFWAEDGATFFADSYNLGLRALIEPYNGYLHTVPRVVAALARLFPPTAAPAIYNACAFLLTLASVASVLSSRVRVPREARALMAFAVVALPMPGDAQLLMNLTNVQWFLAVGLLARCVSEDARTPRDVGVDAAWVFASGLTGPLAIAFAPLFLWRAALRRTGYSLRLALAVGGVAAIQMACLLAHPRSSGIGIPSFAAVFGSTGARLGFALLGDKAALLGPAFGIVLLGAAGAAVVWAIRRRNEALAMLVAGGILALVSALVTIHPAVYFRYFYVPAVALLWCVVAVWHRSPRLGDVVLACSALTLAGNFQMPALQDLFWKEASSCIGVREVCRIPINPRPWEVVVLNANTP